MQARIRSFAVDQYRPPSDKTIAEWAESNIDFSLVPNYDTPAHAPFDASFAPYMVQVLGWLQDSGTREIWIRKCSRAAATEYLLAWLRWIIAERPAPTYYLTADQLTTERFMESRIKRGMATCPAIADKYQAARSTEHDIRFDHMDFRVSWPNAKGAFKQDGWANIIADEFPTWKAFAPDMLRKRAGTYAFHKIVGLGSPDPQGKHPDGDPIILEYQSTDQCLWMMPDPVTGNDFAWEFGGEGKPYGLKWPDECRNAESGEWDLERVRREAYYLTPDGTRIENADRGRISAQGRWVGTAENPPAHVHGIWIVGPMVPFSDGDFGVLAYRFLESKRKGIPALRAYFFENWADVGDMPNSSAVGDTSLRGRELDYNRREPFFEVEGVNIPDDATKGTILTVDVQKHSLWWVMRYWTWYNERCDSGLHDWGNVPTFDDLGAMIKERQPPIIGIDCGYAERFGDVADFCSDFDAYALKGEDNMKFDVNLRDDLDPNEGRKSRSRFGRKYSMITWNTDIFRSKLLAAMRGETPWTWHVPRLIGLDSHQQSGVVNGREYVHQVLSTHKVDGEWVRKKGHANDHLFDCEVMQLVLARKEMLIH